MDISRQVLDHYIGYLTDFYIIDHNSPPEELDDYYDFVMSLKTDVANHQDLETLRLGIKYLLYHREIDLEDRGGMYPWDDGKVREILQYILSVVYPDNSKVDCEEVKDIQLVNMSKFDWWKRERPKNQ